MTTHAVSIAPGAASGDWQIVSEQATRWAEEVTRLADRLQPDLFVLESVQNSRIAATRAFSANEAKGMRAIKLKRSAADAAY